MIDRIENNMDQSVGFVERAVADTKKAVNLLLWASILLPFFHHFSVLHSNSLGLDICINA
uniref:t-SNARE coiled-coil homology domain-containing protein n=1 Tax=Podarcis muralis TaxID=64176 RepID=A0A670HMW3_PODMU